MAETADIAVIDGEDAGTTPWEFDSIAEGGSNSITLQAEAKNHGEYGYKITHDGTESPTSYGKKAFAQQSSLYIRFYLYIPVTYSLGFSDKSLQVLRLYDGGAMPGSVGFEGAGSSTPNRWILRYGASIHTSTTNFSLGEWHYIELEFVQHATTGGLRMYVDGDVILTDLDQDTSAIYPDSIRPGSTWSDATPPLNDYFYLDDILISTIGPIGEYAGDLRHNQPIFLFE